MWRLTNTQIGRSAEVDAPFNCLCSHNAVVNFEAEVIRAYDI